MRISDTFTQSTFLRQLQRVQFDKANALSRMATGVKVRFASDDPSVAAELMRLADERQKLDMRERTIAQARPWLQLTEQGVSQLSNILSGALQYAVQGASDTLQQDEMTALAEQIAGLREQVDGLTSLRVGNRYVFSGTLTDTPAFDANGTYQGNGSTIEVPLDDVNVKINVPGDQIFGQIDPPPAVTGTGPLYLLAQLETAFRNNDHTAVQNLLDPLNDAIAANSAMLARVGNQRKLLEDGSLRIEDRKLEVAQRSGDLSAADLAEAISDATRYETGYQAALAAGSRLFTTNFFDYLG